MKKQRLAVLMGIVGALAVMGSGCGGSDSTAGNDSPPDGSSDESFVLNGGQIVGTWTGEMARNSISDPHNTVVVTFNADNTYSTTEDGVAKESGTWTTNGNVLTMSNSLRISDAVLGQTMAYGVNGNTLVLVTTDSESIGTITFTRL